MDTSSLDKQLTETVECVVNNSENDPFVLGTGKLVTPKKHVEDTDPNLCTPGTPKSPLDFSTVTVKQLGITPESFVKTPSGKSSSLQKIRRRRSAVGVRGSPETNCLIRFIAQQRSLKSATRSPLAHNSPVQGSPGLYRHAGALRERMAAFRSAFHSIQETENMAGGPAASKAERESKTSALIKNEGLVKYQQSGFPINSSSKRRRISSQSSPDDSFSSTKGKVVCEQMLPDHACALGTSADLAEKSSDISSAQPGSVVAPLPQLLKASHGLRVAGSLEGTGSVAIPLDTAAAPGSSDTAPAIRSPVTPVCRNGGSPSKTFVLRSVLKKPGKLFAENIKEYNLCDDGTHLIPDPSNSYKEQKADGETYKAPGFLSQRKRKRVTFGEDLSPEVFDESLPANTPLCKGETPVSQRKRNVASPLQSPVHEPLLQPNFDDEENLENIEPLQVPFASLSPSKPSLSETLPGTNTCSSLYNHEEIRCSFGRPTRTSHRRKQLVSPAEEGVCNSYATEAESCKERNTSRKKSQERKCTNKALPGKKQVLKQYRKKKRKGKKSVEKCLYGERDIASKKPLLSPIPELPEGSEMVPLADRTQTTCSSTPLGKHRNDHDFNLRGELEEVIPLEIPMKRKRLLPPGKGLPEQDPASDQAPVSELCCYELSTPAVSERGPSAMARDTGPGSDSRAERKLPAAKEPKTEAEADSRPVPCASVSPGHTVSEDPESLCQEFSKADQNRENPCDILTVSENVNLKCESEFRAPKGALQCDSFASDSKEDQNWSEDILVQNLPESTNHSEDVGRKCAEKSSLMSGRERKRRIHSMHCYESSYLKQNGNPASSCGGGGSAESSLGNPQLCEDLSAALEQTFQRTNGKAKVRRSTRLQGDLENKGLVWMLLPPPSASQKTKRRITISAFDSSGFESVSSKEETISSGQNPSALPSILSSESQSVGSSKPLGKRRKSCVSTLTNSESTTDPPCFKRRLSLKKRESSQL